MPSLEEHRQVHRTASALMLNALRTDEPSADQAAELLSQLSHLDLIPVTLLLAHLAALSFERHAGGREEGIARLEEQLIHLAALPTGTDA
ncbi:hypothetical protein OHB14_36525 [Streptomyces sp. NBC_01613]|uniref:hypothetical protein n=1 Tax=Streptomyces sp. NBC_01613 TaxID=2975896 RepID=UPI00386651BF